MSNYSREPKQEEGFQSPPFNIDNTYEVFNNEAEPCGSSTAEVSLMERFKELNLPLELYPSCNAEVTEGAMLMIWGFSDQPEALGYALHIK